MISSALAFVACVTGYHPEDGLIGGYQDKKIAPGVWEVFYKGNDNTSVPTVQELALLRALDLLERNGCEHYTILWRDTYTVGMHVPWARVTMRVACAKPAASPLSTPVQPELNELRGKYVR
ncbi:MAG: hypothetical protein GY937_20245 [bacterium]|nr:hypothetical protein [bacterium]